MKQIIDLLWPQTFRLNSKLKVNDAVLFLAEQITAAQPVGTAAPVADEKRDAEARPDNKPIFDEKQMIDMCTQLFRMENNARQLAEKEANRQTRSLDRSQKKMRKILQEFEVEYKDITGETFHPGRKDVDVLAADESDDVKRSVIDKCETPVVSVSGRIIQKAKVTVLMPKKD